MTLPLGRTAAVGYVRLDALISGRAQQGAEAGDWAGEKEEREEEEPAPPQDERGRDAISGSR